MEITAARLVLAALLGFAGVLLLPATAFACSCAMAGPGWHARHADAVFAGTVQHRDGPPWWQPVRSSGDPVTYSVAVDEVYKGRVGEVAQIHSAGSGASCGIEVSTGRDYVLYADRTAAGDLRADLCGGTTAADHAALAAAERTLGAPAPPDASIPPPSPRSSLVLPVAGGALAVTALATIAVALRRSLTRPATAAGGAGRARSR